MNNRYSDEYLLMQYRLKTARRKKRLVKEAHEKMLRQLHIRRQNINNQLRNLGWEELHPPYQRGWKRIFLLKPEMVRSRHASFYETLLAKINTTQYSSRKDFKKKKRVKRKRVYVVTKQELRMLSEHEINKFAEAEQAHFSQTSIYCNYSKRFETKFVLTEPNRFYQLRIMPNMITKVRKKDIELESSLAEIELQIERNHLGPQMNRLIYGSYGHWSWKMNEKEKYKNPIRNWPVQKIIDEYTGKVSYTSKM